MNPSAPVTRTVSKGYAMLLRRWAGAEGREDGDPYHPMSRRLIGPAPPPQRKPRPADVAGDPVRDEAAEQYLCRFVRQQRERNDHQEDREERHALPEVDRLEAVERRV